VFIIQEGGADGMAARCATPQGVALSPRRCIGRIYISKRVGLASLHYVEMPDNS
jgi:hypothetical protein